MFMTVVRLDRVEWKALTLLGCVPIRQVVSCQNDLENTSANGQPIAIVNVSFNKDPHAPFSSSSIHLLTDGVSYTGWKQEKHSLALSWALLLLYLAGV